MVVCVANRHKNIRQTYIPTKYIGGKEKQKRSGALSALFYSYSMCMCGMWMLSVCRPESMSEYLDVGRGGGGGGHNE